MRGYDLVLVGQGLVGAALIKAVQHLPLKIAVIEAVASQPRRDTRSLVLSYASRQILTALKIWPQLDAQTTKISQIHISDKGHFGMTRMRAQDEKVDALGYVIEAQCLLDALQQRQDARAEIDYFIPAQMIEMTRVDERWQIGLDNQEKISTHWLIAADGQNSTLRKLQNIDIEKFDYQQTAIVANVELQRPHNHIAYERFTPQGSIAFLPRQNNQCGLVWSLPQALFADINQLSDAKFLAELQRCFGQRLGRFTQISSRVHFPLSKIQAKQQIGEGWLLLGNAAYTLHPIAAQAFNLCLRDIAQLAEIIDHAIKNQQSLRQALLQRFWQLREADQAATMQFSHRLVQSFRPEMAPFSFARSLAIACINPLIPLRHRLARQAMGLGHAKSKLISGVPLDAG